MPDEPAPAKAERRGWLPLARAIGSLTAAAAGVALLVLHLLDVI